MMRNKGTLCVVTTAAVLIVSCAGGLHQVQFPLNESSMNLSAKLRCADATHYLLCEDWESDAPPPDPWPVKNGPIWKGWEPAKYGQGPGSNILAIPDSPFGRVLEIIKDPGSKSTVDIRHDIPNHPKRIHLRFFLYVTYESLLGLVRSNYVHFIFLNSASGAEIALDFRTKAAPRSIFWKNSLMLAPHSYKPEDWVVATEGGPFFFNAHEDEWVLVEWMVDVEENLTSLWVNEQLIVNNYPMQWDASSLSSLHISGYGGRHETEYRLFVDDIVVDTKYIGLIGN